MHGLKCLNYEDAGLELAATNKCRGTRDGGQT